MSASSSETMQEDTCLGPRLLELHTVVSDGNLAIWVSATYKHALHISQADLWVGGSAEEVNQHAFQHLVLRVLLKLFPQKDKSWLHAQLRS